MSFNTLLIPTDGNDPAEAGPARGADPATETIDYADDRDLDMVMSRHSPGGFSRAGVGSVTDEVVRTASVPELTGRAGPSESPETPEESDRSENE